MPDTLSPRRRELLTAAAGIVILLVSRQSQQAGRGQVDVEARALARRRGALHPAAVLFDDAVDDLLLAGLGGGEVHRAGTRGLDAELARVGDVADAEQRRKLLWASEELRARQAPRAGR